MRERKGKKAGNDITICSGCEGFFPRSTKIDIKWSALRQDQT